MRISDWSSDVCSSDLGSADAAAVLRALARLTQVSPDDPRLAACAVELGADVPACLFGRAALGTGRGEQLAPVDGLTGTPVLLVHPRVAVSTAAVFARWAGDDRGPIAEGSSAESQGGKEWVRTGRSRWSPSP